MCVNLKQYYAGLCVIVRDENKYMQEWVAYHHYIGFEKIYIYDNKSKTSVRNEIIDYIKNDTCILYTIEGETMQNIAYNHCLKNHGHECEWLAFFDLDEFLCLKEDDDVRVFLRDYEEYAGLSVQWDVFSSSGHITSPSGFVTLNYTESLGYNSICKCIVRPKYVKATLTSHHFILHEGITVNPNREPALGMYAPIAVQKICLNHYYYRSQEDFAKKLQKPDATYGLMNPRHWNLFYDQAKKPVSVHHDILPTAKKVLDNLHKGKYIAKYDIRLSDIRNYTINEILCFLAKIISSKKLNFAEVIFSICFKKFAANAEFIRLCVEICMYQKKFTRAQKIIHYWLQNNPTNDAYLTYLECLLAAKEINTASTIYKFLHDMSNYTNDQNLKDKIQRLAKKYTFQYDQ